MAIDVFLSAGRPANEAQEKFLDAVERFLLENELHPLTPGRTHLANTQPLRAVEKCMRTCKGIVVVAYERLYAPVAIERRGGPDSKDWSDAIVPTVWNQIEGAMAYTLGLPVLVIAQAGLRNEALLEDKYDWSVQWVDLDTDLLKSSDFNSVFNDWRNDVVAKEKSTAAPPAPTAATAPVDPGGRTIGQLIQDLRPGQAWKVGTSLFVLIAGAFGLGYKTGLRDAPRPTSPPPAVRTSAVVDGWRSDSVVVR